MKARGMGRILLWNGGSLWVGRFGGSTDFHSHHSVQITLPLTSGNTRLRLPGESWKSHGSVIIAANQPHAFEARGESVAMIFVEPESVEGQALQHRCRETDILSLPLESLQSEIATLYSAYGAVAPDVDLIGLARTLISSLAATKSTVPAKLPDRRIKNAIELMRERVTGAIFLADIAAAVYLSPDRFRHLFIAETGMRFRPYVLWLRMEIALAEFAAHRSLTDASHNGGFADSAHFSRTFRRMFGISPSSIQRD